MSGASLPTIEGYKLNEAEYVLIPDEWGKSSDEGKWKQCMSHPSVLIPDEWGKSSDCIQSKNLIIFNLLYS